MAGPYNHLTYTTLHKFGTVSVEEWKSIFSDGVFGISVVNMKVFVFVEIRYDTIRYDTVDLRALKS